MGRGWGVQDTEMETGTIWGAGEGLVSGCNRAWSRGRREDNAG